MNWNELLNWPEYIKLLVGLIAIINPFSKIPIFLSMTEQATPKERSKIALVTTIAFAVAMLVFTFLGEAILAFFAISLQAFEVAGGLLLLLLALEMMRAPSAHTSESPVESGASLKASMAITPLSIPLLAGPGSLSTIIVYTHQHISANHNILIGLVVVALAVIVFLTLRLAPMLGAFLGQTGMNVFNRIMGLIIASIGVEFLMRGFGAYILKLFNN